MLHFRVCFLLVLHCHLPTFIFLVCLGYLKKSSLSLQSITGLTYAQATGLSFLTALINTVASTLGVQADAISLVNIVVSQNRRVLLSGVSISYTISVSSGISTAYLNTVLDSAVSSGSFASLLSSNSGNPGLSIQGTFSVVTSSPTGAPVATSPSGKFYVPCSLNNVHFITKVRLAFGSGSAGLSG
jgi:hypothetical protein